MDTSGTVWLKKGREKALLRRHPWVFSGAIGRVEGTPQPGDTVIVRAADGRGCGRGAWSPSSQIRVRMWTFDKSRAVDEAFFRERVGRAVAARKAVMGWEEAGGCRLIFAESDGLPGVVVDRYGPWLVCQFLTVGAERWHETIVAALRTAVPCRGVYERSDTVARVREGLAKRTGPIAGDEPPEAVSIEEHGCRYLVDIRGGHKTGFYLDQCRNRHMVARYAKDAEVLNCFAYTGGFGTAARAHGAARVTNVDSSEAALGWAKRADEANGFESGRVSYVAADVFSLLRTYRDERRRFDLIVLDPPKFVENRGQLARGCRGYKDINLLACKLLRPGGLLATFSCSGLVAPELFQKIVADAALDAEREGGILYRLDQAPDHPVALPFPEAHYLKGMLVRIE